MVKPSIRLACICAAALLPIAAYGSFGGTPCRDDFACHFQVWGLLLGVVGGIPISGVIFVLLHVGFRHRARSKVGHWLLSAFLGFVAFEVAAVCAALMGAWGESSAGYHSAYPVVGLLSSYVVLAILYVLYARSAPTSACSG